uniref:RNA-directed DNA polymerase homolog n=1 Tax=Nicotiana tabacum TaxID=4097 RepID=A0A1S3YIA7_TOBAC|nr:PREDICTED: RNA-directed DNA polymerase homolog [Nicotiana tabacum]
MSGIPKEIATHKLNVDPFYPPVRQIRRKFNSAINDVVREEVEKLMKNGSIRESKYPQWVANVVMVQKKNGKWWMCVDFTDLNKACPKDSFPLPHIDQHIDATARHELLSFLDAYSGYNQIPMEEEDQEKTTFFTHYRTYCYKVISLGLKNMGATYQRLVTKMFKDQLGKTMKVYIDDMLVKSKRMEDHINHLKNPSTYSDGTV